MSDEVPSVTQSAERQAGLTWLPRPTPVEWVCLLGGLTLTIRYAWLMDDAYVYFRYVDNLLYLGRGLVYNAGEYVEGFSSPLWVLLLIPLRATGLNFWIIIRLVAVLAFIAFWLLLVILNRQLSPPNGPRLNFPLCYLAFNYGVLSYFTSGLETPLVTVAAALYALWVLNPGSPLLQVLLGLTPLLRPELSVPFAICVIWLWVRQRRFPLRMALAGFVPTGSWLAFRVYYYADLLPNTFYLKDALDVRQGLIYLLDTATPYWLFAVLGFFALAVIALRYRRPAGERDSLRLGRRLMMIALGASVAAYVVKIGGDPRHFRFLAFPFCLWICACAGIIEQLAARYSLARFRVWGPIAGLSVAAGSAACYPPQLNGHPLIGPTEIRAVNKITDAAFFRAPLRHRRFELFPLDSGDKIEFKDEYARFRAKNPACGHTGLSTRGKCAVHYADFETRALHRLGLTDPILAHTEMRPRRPGHKFGLAPLAETLGAIVLSHGNAPYRGMYREAAASGEAPAWIEENLESIEILERKMLNRHDWLENLRLAFTFPEKIKPPSEDEGQVRP